MASGTIKNFLTDKSFGFIRTDSGADVFFHSSAVKAGDMEKIVKGAEVEFDLALKKGKEQAVTVSVTAGPKPSTTSFSGLPKRKPAREELSELEEFEREWGLRAVF
jgi:cold shock CspA family protein